MLLGLLFFGEGIIYELGFKYVFWGKWVFVTFCKRYVKYVICFFIFIVCIPLFFKIYLTLNQTPEEQFFYKKMNQFLSENRNIIPLTELTHFYWDYVYYIGPYTYLSYNKGIIVNNIFYKVPKHLQYDLDSDGMWALCFISDNAVIHIIRGRKITAYSQNLKQHIYDSNDVIVIDDQGGFYLKEIE